MSSDPEQDYCSNAMTEDRITQQRTYQKEVTS